MAEIITVDFMVGTKDEKDPSRGSDLDHGHAWLSYI